MNQEPEPVNYFPFLNQDKVWPSASSGENEPICDMHTAHAIRSYHRLNKMVTDAYNSKLSMALLKQAVGEDVIFASDAAVNNCDHIVLFDLEECYDIIQSMNHFVEAHPPPHLMASVLHMQKVLHDMQSRHFTTKEIVNGN